MYTDTHCSIIYNSQDIEIIYKSNDRQMDKEDMVQCNIIQKWAEDLNRLQRRHTDVNKHVKTQNLSLLK